MIGNAVVTNYLHLCTEFGFAKLCSLVKRLFLEILMPSGAGDLESCQTVHMAHPADVWMSS
jgi:hypothetical protein